MQSPHDRIHIEADQHEVLRSMRIRIESESKWDVLRRSLRFTIYTHCDLIDSLMVLLRGP